MRSAFSVPTALAATVLLAVALSGCSASPEAAPKPTPTAAAETQSAEDACNAIKESVATVGQKMSDTSTLLATDIEGGAAQFDAAAVEFAASVEEIDNEEVYDAALAASASVTSFSEVINGIAADPASMDSDVLTAAAGDFQETFTALGEVCSAATK